MLKAEGRRQKAEGKLLSFRHLFHINFASINLVKFWDEIVSLPSAFCLLPSAFSSLLYALGGS